MALRHIKTKRSLKDENKHLHSLVKHLQIELENARLDLCIKNDAISGYKNENIRLRQRINSMYAYDVFGEEVQQMKKGTTIESGYDASGRWCLKLRKAKGKFTLDEIIEAAKEWEEDYYAVIIKAMSDETAQYYDDDLDGDCVTLYRATDFISNEV